MEIILSISNQNGGNHLDAILQFDKQDSHLEYS